MLSPALRPTRNDSTTTLIRIILILICIMVLTVFASDHEIEANYDIDKYKLLQVGETLELICKNLLNRDPPSWRYSSRLHNDPRMKLSQYVGESRLVINYARVEDAGQYECSIEHEYNGKTFCFSRTIEVIVNEIREVKVEEEKDSIKLLCDVHAYPSATIIWKIDYVNTELNATPEDRDLEYNYWVSPDEKVEVYKSDGRLTLKTYNGVKNAELIIADVTENDDGNYTCVAKSIAGDQSKDCTVTVKREAAGEGKSSEDFVNYNSVELKDEKKENSGILKAANQETENTQEVEGLSGKLLILMISSFVVLGSVIGTLIAFCWIKLHQEKEEEIKESPEGSSPLLIINNDVSKV